MSGLMVVSLILLIAACVFAWQGVAVVPQQTAWVVERLGKFHAVLNPGLNFIIPFIDRVAYKHSLKEVPLDTPSQVCITNEKTQLTVDGVLYFQGTDPQRASYGTSNYIIAITQLAQTTLRSVVGRMELDKTFEERDVINRDVVSAIDEAALNWAVRSSRLTLQRVPGKPQLPNPKAKSRRRLIKPKVRQPRLWLLPRPRPKLFAVSPMPSVPRAA